MTSRRFFLCQNAESTPFSLDFDAKMWYNMEDTERGETVDIVIGEKQNGKMVLNVLAGDLGLSRRMITFLKHKENGILLNGVHVTVRNKLKTGDVLSIDYADTENSELSAIAPVSIPLDIVYEDNDILLINKPFGMPTHPSHEHQADTLANALAYLCKTRGKPFVFRAINRLDAGTSGLVLIAKHKLAASRLSAQMTDKKIRKTYFAILHGSISPDFGDIEGYMRLEEGGRMKREVCDKSDEGAMYALTRYKRVCVNDLYSAVLAMPVTGRTHQLRVHFSSLGHPLCGDTLYGYPSGHISRQALHAYRLSFFHPATGQAMKVTAPIPRDISSLFETVFNKKLPSIKEESYE